MIKRTRETDADREIYFDRGIRVCDLWRRDFSGFLAHIGPKPSPKHSVDRIDNGGDYEPGNVRWALPDVQANNKRNNFLVAYHGIEMTIHQAWDLSGRVISITAVRGRLQRHGWPVDLAFDTPKLILAGKRPKGSRFF